ncbi:23S rRNA (adenine(1618)-N(6))-methyltransferase RlmF [Psychrosphaera sp. B3R10]|uniref:23S rRNA (adenine(1618)-N(6))-methyltransferase RlmF n=1 Tax=unclassified Psychrosphaera TaxID=2641570 RepID=UPI001C09A98B|nr:MULTISPECIES: 23S rRNA (adenine(1618)-N(6))-methyltransferase RlmF [unclassified Psychrosphaera]MBU2881194.1 23S rRNA (adenine(1618)-N(6))-methyltransferase RlmF [Psychrosphaera sp. I2R16]MBU2988299.1 23S rRNA (adenine(1618)-N(6))-methyltransferase RlmF [Psychrosphaera sp. B3R10]MDO6718508.1 23S rRNA (adenine(1618)-N(6))-methyltransferase RlmF [Psychrosphaera sp. 1_MG-2023]
MQKSKLHPRNRHTSENGVGYDFTELCKVNPTLTSYLKTNPKGIATINFADDIAVKELNKSLLLSMYGLVAWDLPEQFLCPPIPGRADYIHYLADLIQTSTKIKKIVNRKIKGLDIGTGANLVYPIIGNHEYQWQFVGTDIDPDSINWAKQLSQFNPKLKSALKLRMQTNSLHVLDGIIKQNDRFTFSMCNPPFHSSQEEAEQGSKRKIQNLNKGKNTSSKDLKLNFGGRSNELWCEGGEISFVQNMVRESQQFGSQVLWFTSLISKKQNLPAIYTALNQVKAVQVKTVDMAQGNKVSRFVAWSFLTSEQHKHWFD